jgi:hypothetical protein
MLYPQDASGHGIELAMIVQVKEMMQLNAKRWMNVVTLESIRVGVG